MGLNLEGQTVDLAQIAGMDMGNVEAREFAERFPKCIAEFKGLGGEVDSFGSGDEERPVVRFKFECLNADNVQDFKDAAGNNREAATLIGREYDETCFLDMSSKPKFVESLGYVKSLVMAITGKPENEISGSLQDMIEMTVDSVFRVPIVHRKNKNDVDNPYVNMDRTKILPVSAVPEASAA